ISTAATYGNKLREATIHLAGARSLIALPMLKDDEVIGAIVIYRQEVRPFTEKQIELVQNFAAQAVIAIENTRLLNELRESLQQQTATADVLKVISSSTTDLQPIFEAIASRSVTLCGAAYGVVYRYDGELISVVAHHNLEQSALDALNKIWPMRPDPERTLMGQSFLSGLSFISLTSPLKSATPLRQLIRKRLAFARFSVCRCCETESRLALSPYIVTRRGCSLTGKLNSSRLSPIRPLSRSRTRACLVSFANPFSNRQQLPTFSRSLAAQRFTWVQCFKLSSNPPLGSAMRIRPTLPAKKTESFFAPKRMASLPNSWIMSEIFPYSLTGAQRSDVRCSNGARCTSPM